MQQQKMGSIYICRALNKDHYKIIHLKVLLEV